MEPGHGFFAQFSFSTFNVLSEPTNSAVNIIYTCLIKYVSNVQIQTFNVFLWINVPFSKDQIKLYNLIIVLFISFLIVKYSCSPHDVLNHNHIVNRGILNLKLNSRHFNKKQFKMTDVT